MLRSGSHPAVVGAPAFMRGKERFSAPGKEPLRRSSALALALPRQRWNALGVSMSNRLLARRQPQTPSPANKSPLRAPPTLCHPERTQISCFTATLATTYVVLPKENHMQSTEAATLDRKSGAAEGSAVRLSVFPNSSCQPPTPKPRCHPAPAVSIPRKPSPLRAPPTPLSSRADPDFLLHRYSGDHLCGSP